MTAPARVQERRASWHLGQVELAVQNFLLEQVDKSTNRKELKTVALAPKEGKMLCVHDRDFIVARSAGAVGKPKDTFRVDVGRGVVIDWLVGVVDGQSVQIGRCVSKSCVEIKEDASAGPTQRRRSKRKKEKKGRARTKRAQRLQTINHIIDSARCMSVEWQPYRTSQALPHCPYCEK